MKTNKTNTNNLPIKEVLSALIVAYISWLSYTVLELSKQNTLIEYKLDRIHEVLQTFSEELTFVSGRKYIFKISKPIDETDPFDIKDSNNSF
jgi:hypothetical protein